MTSEPPSDRTNQPPRIPTSGGPGTKEDPLAKGLLDWAGPLRNRFILGGIGVIVVLFLAAIVLVAVGGGDDEFEGRIASGTEVPGDSTAGSVRGLSGEARTTTTMRNGPGATYAILGTIPRGAVVSIVGRNADEAWLQVTYPAGSQLRGWVPSGSLNVSGDISRLSIEGPGENPSAFVPTNPAPIIVDPGPLGTAPPPLPTNPPPTAVIVTPVETEAPTALPSVAPSATATPGPTKPPTTLTPAPATPTEPPVKTATPRR